ncbi:stomatal closure-related actin-binding protein 1-like protein [Tanacetum coccineum]
MLYGSIGWSVGAKEKYVIASIGDGSFQVRFYEQSYTSSWVPEHALCLCWDMYTWAGKVDSGVGSKQLYGVKGGGNVAAQASFWQPKIELSFVLGFESERERNAAIMLTRRFSFDCNIMLAGPNDRAAQKS